MIEYLTDFGFYEYKDYYNRYTETNNSHLLLSENSAVV